MTFQRISFGEKRGCVALGQPGAQPGIGRVAGWVPGEAEKETQP